MFQKGTSGNPNGRPKKGESISDLLRERLPEANALSGDGKTTYIDEIVSRILKLAASGDRWAIKFLTERTDGLPIQRNEIEGGFEIEIIMPPPEQTKEDLL